MSVDVAVIDVQHIGRAFRESPAKMKAELQVALREGAAIVQRLEKQEAPIDMGLLRNSVSVSFDSHSATIWPRMNYAAWVNEGTGLYGPHHTRVVPVRAKFLAWKSGGKWVFARSTKGMKANPFVDRTYAGAQEPVQAAFKSAVDRVLS